METNAFRIERDKTTSSVTLRLTRPANGNRLEAAEIPLLGHAIREAGSDRGVKLLIVRADGAHFCQGRIPDPPGKSPTTALDIRSRVTQPILDVYADVRATPVPVIAVVQGEAKGFGCAFVAQCDLAIAADDALFSLPEMDHDLPPTLAMSAMLHKVPPKRMLHMVYTREPIGAAEALSLGIISQIAPREHLDSAVGKTLARLADRSRAALCAIKEYMGAALYADPNGAARLAANLLATVLSSPKHE